jgi:hypothetical protein
MKGMKGIVPIGPPREKQAPAGHNLISAITAGLNLQAVPFGDSVTLFSLAREGVPDGQEQTSHVAGE